MEKVLIWLTFESHNAHVQLRRNMQLKREKDSKTFRINWCASSNWLVAIKKKHLFTEMKQKVYDLDRMAQMTLLFPVATCLKSMF